MTNALSKIQKYADPLGHKIAQKGMVTNEQAAAQAQAAAAGATAASAQDSPAGQAVAARPELPSQQRAAGGLSVDDNQADLLGNTQTKRRAASRALMG